MAFSKTVGSVEFDGDGYIVEKGRWAAGGDTSGTLTFDSSGDFGVGPATVATILETDFRADVAGNVVTESKGLTPNAVIISMLGTAAGSYMLRGKAV